MCSELFIKVSLNVTFFFSLYCFLYSVSRLAVCKLCTEIALLMLSSLQRVSVNLCKLCRASKHIREILIKDCICKISCSITSIYRNASDEGDEMEIDDEIDFHCVSNCLSN